MNLFLIASKLDFCDSLGHSSFWIRIRYTLIPLSILCSEWSSAIPVCPSHYQLKFLIIYIYHVIYIDYWYWSYIDLPQYNLGLSRLNSGHFYKIKLFLLMLIYLFFSTFIILFVWNSLPYLYCMANVSSFQTQVKLYLP